MEYKILVFITFQQLSITCRFFNDRQHVYTRNLAGIVHLAEGDFYCGY